MLRSYNDEFMEDVADIDVANQFAAVTVTEPVTITEPIADPEPESDPEDEDL